MRETMKRLYYGDDTVSRYFRFSLLIFDLVTIIFFVVTSAVEPTLHWYIVDYLIALVLLSDYVARAAIANRAWRFIVSFTSIADMIVIVSLLAAPFIENLAFLRVIRMLRLLRSYHVVHELRDMSSWFRRNHEIIESTVNLFVFVFVVTAIVFVLENDRNPNINNYLDALYFTVATLTTTGFGDITMTDTAGRVLSVVIMVVGVGLFLRLVQTIFRPAKVSFPCPDCGLQRHDPDA
ncbi:MAG: potassium channel family protein, partial [Hyphomicrobiales bacterium]|nr:potassium channel family protein [Hyphomicrobiales bacterium]